VLYIRGGTTTISAPSTGDPFVNGHRYLMRDVTIGAGDSDFDVDIPTARIMGSVTLAGAALPPTNNNDLHDASVFLVAQDTGARHVLSYVRYRWTAPSVFTLVAGDGAIDLRLVPGTYDVLYIRGGTTTISAPTTGDPFVNGHRYLRRDVVIGPGTSSFSVNIPATRLTGRVTLAGDPLPATINNDLHDAAVHRVADDTDARHVLSYARYRWTAPSVFTLIAGDGAYDLRLVPGTYHVLYARGGTTTVSPPTAGDPFVNGYRYLGECVAVP
jgi:hypothetical protein